MAATNKTTHWRKMTKTEETKVSVLVSLFNWIQKTKPAAKKRSKFRKFLDTYCDSADYFSALRLILPSLDRERGSYGLKESVLANCLIDALGMSKDSADAIRLLNWRKGGTAPNAGNFPMVAAEVCFVFSRNIYIYIGMLLLESAFCKSIAQGNYRYCLVISLC